MDKTPRGIPRDPIKLADDILDDVITLHCQDSNQDNADIIHHVLGHHRYQDLSECAKLFVLTQEVYEPNQFTLQYVYDINNRNPLVQQAFAPVLQPAVSTFPPQRPPMYAAPAPPVHATMQNNAAPPARMNAAAPQMNAAPPAQMNAAAPQIYVAAPQMNVVSPQINAAAPPMYATAPQINAAAPPMYATVQINPAPSQMNVPAPASQINAAAPPMYATVQINPMPPQINVPAPAPPMYAVAPQMNAAAPQMYATVQINVAASQLNAATHINAPAPAPQINAPAPPMNTTAPQMNAVAPPVYAAAPQMNAASALNAQIAAVQIKHRSNRSRHRSNGSKSLWEYVISTDKVNCMEALLSYTPLYAINKANISPYFTWIKSPEWMQNSLENQRARWDGQMFDYFQYGQNCTGWALQMNVLKQIAFTMHAAELFSQCCKYNAMECMKYLLRKAPNLIHMKASSDNNRNALQSALLYNSQVVDLLLHLGARLHPEKGLVTLVEIYRGKDQRSNIGKATDVIFRGNENQLRPYTSGCFLLHVLYRHLHQGGLPHLLETVCSTQLILKAGFDPTIKSDHKSPALHVLASTLMRNLTYVATVRDSITQYTNVVQTLVACAQMILPLHRGGLPGVIKLPSSINGPNVTRQNLCLQMIVQLQAIVDTDMSQNNSLFVHNILHCFVSLRENVQYFERHDACLMCAPIVKLLFTVMRQQYYATEQEFLEKLVRLIVTDISVPLGCLVPEQCSVPNCCSWELLELVVHAGADLLVPQYHDRSLWGQPLYLQHIGDILSVRYDNHILLGCDGTLQRIPRFVRMCWIHFTSTTSRQLTKDFIDRVIDLVINDTAARSVVEDLYVFIENVLPLTTLTRQCILHHVHWKNVAQLPLPTVLKVFIRVEDIAADHPVYKMSLNELAA